tara:strand:- start:102 stop:326 length:225 start_codon:yes stop_codon:yes gene_type:complete
MKTSEVQPILDYEVLQLEVARAWKILPEKIGKELFIGQDINQTVQSILEALVFDYAMALGAGHKKDLNYSMAEA